MWLNPLRFEVIDDDLAEVMRAKSGSEKLKIIDGLWRLTRNLIRGDLHRKHPEWNESRLNEETARRMSRGAV